MITTPPDLSPAAAIAGLKDALDQVITTLDTAELAQIDDDQLLHVIGDFETLRNQMQLVDHNLITACEIADLPHRLAKCSTTKFLTDTLRIESGEAHRRVQASHALHSQPTMLGEELEPQRPVLAAGIATGHIPACNTDRAVRCLKTLSQLPWITPDQLTQAEQNLTDNAQIFGPKEFDVTITELIDAINPDGTLGDEQVHQAQRDLQIWLGRDGAWRIHGRLTPGTGEKINAVLQPLAAPQDTHDEPDNRTPGQRMHDAIDEAFSKLLNSDQIPATGGTPASVIITIDWDNLHNRTGHGWYADGTPVAPETILNLADQADIIPTLLARNGKVLWLGRTKRIADKNQTAAMIARDGGCSFPGCDRPPDWCQRHHIISWLDGGPTNIDNMCLLCKYHHGHFEQLGWQCRMTNGLPYWIPPRWIDPEQKPRLNQRIQLRHQPTAT